MNFISFKPYVCFIITKTQEDHFSYLLLPGFRFQLKWLFPSYIYVLNKQTCFFRGCFQSTEANQALVYKKCPFVRLFCCTSWEMNIYMKMQKFIAKLYANYNLHGFILWIISYNHHLSIPLAASSYTFTHVFQFYSREFCVVILCSSSSCNTNLRQTHSVLDDDDAAIQFIINTAEPEICGPSAGSVQVCVSEEANTRSFQPSVLPPHIHTQMDWHTHFPTEQTASSYQSEDEVNFTYEMTHRSGVGVGGAGGQLKE